MMYVDKVLDDEFWEHEFKGAADEAGLTKLSVTVTALCVRYLGLSQRSWCSDADDTLVERLMEALLASGNSGAKQAKGNKVETTVANFRREGLFRYLQIAGENNWKAYRRHHVLRPLCWLYQIFRYIRQGAPLSV